MLIYARTNKKTRTMKNIMICIAIFLGLTAFGQEKKEYTLNGQTFWVVTEKFPSCFGGTYERDRLYHSASGEFLNLNTECLGCPVRIQNVTMSDGVRLAVEYTQFYEEQGGATFYFIEEKWRFVMKQESFVDQK